MLRRTVLKGLAATAAGGLGASRVAAQEVLKMGVSIPMTGAGFNAVGRQLSAALKLYVQEHGDVVAGRKLQIIVRDDAGVADNARRIVQEMIVNEKVSLLGIGTTPTSLAIAPLVTEARIPTLVMSSGAAVTVTKSPYMTRAGFLQGQQGWIMAEWAAKNGSKRVVTLVNDWAPEIESETAFKTRFLQEGGENIQIDPHSARQSRFRAVPAAHPRHQSGHCVHLFPGPAGGHFCQAIRRAGPWPIRHQDHRAG